MSTTNKQTKTKFGHIGGDKRNSLTKAVSPSPKVLQPRVKKVLPQSRNLSCKGEGEHVSKHPTSPTVWEATKGVHFSLAPPRVLNPNLHGGRGEWGWRCQERDEESGGAEERQVWSREMT